MAPALDLELYLNPSGLVLNVPNAQCSQSHPSSLVSQLEDSKVIFSSYIAAATLVGIVNARELVLVGVSLSHKLLERFLSFFFKHSLHLIFGFQMSLHKVPLLAR